MDPPWDARIPPWSTLGRSEDASGGLGTPKGNPEEAKESPGGAQEGRRRSQGGSEGSWLAAQSKGTRSDSANEPVSGPTINQSTASRPPQDNLYC